MKAASLARRLREKFTPEDGAAMFANCPRPARRSRDAFSDDGIVPVALHDGSAEASPWGRKETALASVSLELAVRFFLNGGPATPRGAFLRMVAAAQALGIVDSERASRIAKASPRTLRRIRQKLSARAEASKAV
jgi:hypothetical protein